MTRDDSFAAMPFQPPQQIRSRPSDSLTPTTILPMLRILRVHLQSTPTLMFFRCSMDIGSGGGNYSVSEPSLTVHYWSPEIRPFRIGHAALTLQDGTHISWWPAAEGSDLDHILGVQGRAFSLEQDEKGENNTKPVNVVLKGFDQEKIERWWNTFSTNPERECSATQICERQWQRR